MGIGFNGTNGRRPREIYASRTLIADRNVFLARVSRQHNVERDESLPEGWEIIWPNRIRERREACKITKTTDLAALAGHISYQRLARLEAGTHIGRRSELELIARPLKCHPDELELPVLTLSQTREWKRQWSRARTSGGDHDAVLLAAYVRHLVELTGQTRNEIIKLIGAKRPIPMNCLSKIWFASCSIDRHPDTTMSVIMQVSGMKSWEEVIFDSRTLYSAGTLAGHIEEVRAPRVRYAPEDPDARAPWTFVADPFRNNQKRRVHISAHTTRPSETKTEMLKRQKREDREAIAFETREFCRKVIEWTVGAGAVNTRLHRLFPADPAATKALYASMTDDQARIAAVRARIVKRAGQPRFHTATAAAMLGITAERLRQLTKIPSSSIAITGFAGRVRKDHN